VGGELKGTDVIRMIKKLNEAQISSFTWQDVGAQVSHGTDSLFVEI